MRVLLIAMMVGSAAFAMAGEPSTNSVAPSAIRQDLTGQGSYHRLGLLREQDRALAARPEASPTPAAASEGSWLGRLWRSLFPPKSGATPRSSGD